MAQKKSAPSNGLAAQASPVERAHLRLECLKLATQQARHTAQLAQIAEQLFMYLFSKPGEALTPPAEGGG